MAGGTKQHRLTIFRTPAENFFDGRANSDVEHAVGFVEHDAPEIIEDQRTSLNVINDSPRRTDHDFDAPTKFLDLSTDGFATVDCQRARSCAVGQLANFLVHLHSQLSRRTEDQGLGIGCFTGRIEQVDNRDCEGCRFTGTGLSLPNHIVAIDGPGDQAALKRGGRVVSCFDESITHSA